MPLFVTADSREANVGLDLLHILLTDSGNLGTPSSGMSQDQVSYAQGQNSFAKDRMNDIINSTPLYPIVITGVDNTFVLSDGSPITSSAGVTSVPIAAINTAGTGLASNTTIMIVYDVTGCGGSGYCGYDAAGNSISLPTEGILFHELAHAFHWANNDMNQASAEPQAENDENQLRSEEGFPLRDPNNHSGGCGNCPPLSKPCFIVTAAYGSPYAAQVEYFRQLRDSLLRRSVLGDHFVDRLLDEYYLFSPQVAQDMDASPQMRSVVTALLVEPLLSYVAILQKYSRGAWLEPSLIDEVASSLKTTIRHLSDSHSQWEPRAVLEGLLHLDSSDIPPSSDGNGESALRSNPAPIFSYLKSVIRADDRPTAYVRWALLTPLVLYWTALSQVEQKREQAAARWLIGAMEDWVTGVPIPPSLASVDSSQLFEGLSILGETVFVRPFLREKFGSRLLSELGSRVNYDLAALIERAGYMPSQPSGASSG